MDVEAFADLFTNVHGRIFTMEPRASEIVAALRDTFNLSPAEKSKMELVVGDRLATFVKMIYAIEEKKEDKEFKDNLVRFLTQSCEQFSLQYSPYDQAWEKIRGYLRHGEHRRALLWLFFLLQNIRPEVLLHPSDILLLSKKAPLHHFAFASGADFLGNRTQMVNGLIDERERRAHIKDFADVARNERIARNYKVVFDSAFIPDYFASLQKYGTVSAWRVMRDLSIKARQAFIMIDFAFAKSALQSSRELVDEMRNLSVLGDSVMASNGARDMLRSLYLGIEQGNILRPLKDFLHDASKFTFDGHALTWDTHLVNLPDFEKLVGDAKTAIDRLVDSLHIPEITMDGTTSTAVIFSERLAKLSFARAFDEMLMRIRPIVGVDYTFTPEYVLADMIDEVAAVYPSIRAAFVAVPRRAALPPPPPPPPAYHGLGLDPDFVKKIDLLDILPADKEILGRILAATKGPDYLKGFKLRGFFKNIRNNEKKDLAAQAAAMQTLKDDNPDI